MTADEGNINITPECLLRYQPVQKVPSPIHTLTVSVLHGIAFTGLVTGVAVWAIWGGDMFPQEADPTGDPERWTKEEMRRWLERVSFESSAIATYHSVRVISI